MGLNSYLIIKFNRIVDLPFRLPLITWKSVVCYNPPKLVTEPLTYLGRELVKETNDSSQERLLSRLKNPDLVKKIIFLIILIFLIRGIIYAVIFPLWQAPDEAHHFLNVANLAKRYIPSSTANLSLKDIPTEHKTFQIFSLYYWLSFPIYLLFSGAKMITQVYAIRIFTVFLGAIVIFLTYKICLEIVPDNKFIVLGAPLFITLQPMFTYISSMINNDNLANVFAAAFILISVRCITRGMSWKKIVGLLLFTALAILAKRSTFFLIPLAIFVLPLTLIFRTKSKDQADFNKRLGIAATILIATLFVLPLLNVLNKILARSPRSLYESYSVIRTFFQNPNWSSTLQTHFEFFFSTFWANFGWPNVAIALTFYQILKIFCCIPIIGMLVLFIREKVASNKNYSRSQLLSIIFLVVCALSALLIIFIYDSILAGARAAPHGRYSFTTISALAFLFTLGISQLIPKKYYFNTFMSFALLLFLFDSICIFKYIIPFYYSTFTVTAAQLKVLHLTKIPLVSVLSKYQIIFTLSFCIYLLLTALFVYLCYKRKKELFEFVPAEVV